MPDRRHVLQADHPDYGIVCPECASPKHRQSKRCAQCYYAARRRHEFPAPPIPQRKPATVRVRGGSKGRPQPANHPWRGKNNLLFVQTRAREMADQGVRPATAGGRVRAHFATLDRDTA